MTSLLDSLLFGENILLTKKEIQKLKKKRENIQCNNKKEIIKKHMA